jgi:hypothetical protein
MIDFEKELSQEELSGRIKNAEQIIRRFSELFQKDFFEIMRLFKRIPLNISSFLLDTPGLFRCLECIRESGMTVAQLESLVEQWVYERGKEIGR